MESTFSVEQLHARLLEMAKAFHKVCVENGFHYYMLGGTMLGAIRHQGFIPWDDDMDFGMLREEYDRFINTAEHLLPPEYELRFYQNTDNSPMHYIKLIDKRTTLIEKNYKNYVEGLYIDVFPLDGAGNGSVIDLLRMKRIRALFVLIMSHCSTQEKHGLGKIVKSYAQWRDLDRLHIALENLMTKKRLTESSLIANYLGAWAEKEMMNKDIFGVPKKYQFEDTEFYGVDNPKEYLHSLYGDFMELPPEEKRVLKHNYYYLNFDLPYRTWLDDKKKQDQIGQ